MQRRRFWQTESTEAVAAATSQAAANPSPAATAGPEGLRARGREWAGGSA